MSAHYCGTSYSSASREAHRGAQHSTWYNPGQLLRRYGTAIMIRLRTKGTCPYAVSRICHTRVRAVVQFVSILGIERSNGTSPIFEVISSPPLQYCRLPRSLSIWHCCIIYNRNNSPRLFMTMDSCKISSFLTISNNVPHLNVQYLQ